MLSIIVRCVKLLRRAAQATWSFIFRFLSENPFGLSLSELVFTLFVSNAALWFLIFIYMVDTKGARLTPQLMWEVISNNFAPSEILIYILALIAPALWIMAHNWRARKYAAFYWVLLMVQAVIVTGSAYIYGRSKTGAIENPDFVSQWAVACLILGVLILYTTLVYKRTVIRKIEPPDFDSGGSILRDLESTGE